MEALVEIEDVIHDASSQDAVAIAPPEAGGKVRPRSSARGFRAGRRGQESDNFAALADLDLFTLFDPVEDSP